MTQLPNNKESAPPLLEVMRADFIKVRAWLKTAATNFVAWTFATSIAGAWRRRWLAIFGFAAIWARAAANAHPIQLSGALLKDFTLYPFAALFSADIMRHVVMAALVFWLSLRLAAIYLDDVFELGDISIAEQYILQAVFASSYDTIHIRDGQVAREDQNSPVARIGGPGLVQVHLENTALFEKMDGTPRVIGPTSVPAVLDRFERLRAVVDLRNQAADFTAQGRTKDGIHISSQGAQVVYSVMRGNKEPTLDVPHPYREEAVEQIAYGQSVFKAFGGQDEKSSPGIKGTNSLKPPSLNMRTFIQSALRDFISQHTLSEFLASIRDPEIEQRRRQEETLQTEVERLSADTKESQVPKDTKMRSGKIPKNALFFSRDQITELIYREINTKAQQRGMELHWVDIGTWVLPDEAKAIPNQHLEAWNLSVENMAKGSPQHLETLCTESHNQELTRLFQEIPLSAFIEYQLNDLSYEQIVRELALIYREKLRNAWKSYEDRGEAPPEELDIVVRFLGWVTTKRIGEQDHA